MSNDCIDVKEDRTMDKQLTQIPYYLHEGELVRMERNINRIAIVCIVETIALLLLGVVGWKQGR